jgi:hypothetical protein
LGFYVLNDENQQVLLEAPFVHIVGVVSYLWVLYSFALVC